MWHVACGVPPETFPPELIEAWHTLYHAKEGLRLYCGLPQLFCEEIFVCAALRHQPFL